MRALLADIDARLTLAFAGGGQHSTRRVERGKLLVRDRIEPLLGRDIPFLRLTTLAAWGSEYTVCSAIVSGANRNL